MGTTLSFAATSSGCWANCSSEFPSILLKANVCKLLEPKLKGDGFNVLNKGRCVYFPASGQQLVFDRQFGEIVPPS